jgi:hypothetical protein
MVDMNTPHPSIQKARSLASRLRTNRHDRRGWDGAVDRDLVRETHEAYLLAQSSSPTLH